MFWSAGTTLACMPDFPETFIHKTDKDLLAAPSADFVAEMKHLMPTAEPAFHAVLPKNTYRWEPLAEYGPKQTNDAGLADLQAATANLPQGPRQAVADQFMAWRQSVTQGRPAALPPGLPEEFALYERGAAAYHAKDLAGARQWWMTLLALPAGQRPYRSVWAAYMVGRTFSDSDHAQAVRYFQQTRQLAQQGFGDSLGLAATSYGWEARALWQERRIEEAIALFLQEMHAGDPLAPWSLRDCAAELIKGDAATLATAAKTPLARQVVTAYLICRGLPAFDFQPPPDFSKNNAKWLAAVSAARITDLRGADRLAWLAYQGNNPEDAGKWLQMDAKEGENTPLGMWIRAKLFLRHGNIDKASPLLAKAAAAFPKNDEWNVPDVLGWDSSWSPGAHAAGELAMLKLGRAQFTDAMDLLYRHGFWEDTARIAEQVLTPEELQAYVDTNWPAAKSPPQTNNDPYRNEGRNIRVVLARRLTRIGQWKEARAYFSPELQKVLDTYVAAIREGNDAKRSNSERAKSLWTAAKIARTRGMDILATELEPDNAIWAGNFNSDGVKDRLAVATQPDHKLSPLTTEEAARLKKDVPPDMPTNRFSYRYTAADHAWAAAQLMPNDTQELADLLTQAGTWLKAQNPKAADRFYKALVNRCPSTDLAKKAAQLKWFPPVPETGMANSQ
jgi:hypothetical protein